MKMRVPGTILSKPQQKHQEVSVSSIINPTMAAFDSVRAANQFVAIDAPPFITSFNAFK